MSDLHESARCRFGIVGHTLDDALRAIRVYRLDEEGWPWEQSRALIEDHPNSSWVLFKFVWIVAYDAALPDSWEYAVWRETGAVHRVIDGEVQDPELFRL